MKYVLNISSAAENDIREIIDYFDNTLKNPGAANSFLSALKEQAAIISDNPFVAAEITEPTIKRLHLRKIMVRKYMMFYEIANNDVNIIRILHGRRQWESILFDEHQNS